MNVSAWSIRNPVPAILLFALLTLLGIMGFRALGIQNFPDIELPRVIISASLEGAAPTQLETDVARKIEDKVATLGGVQHIRTTLSDGRAEIQLEFDIDVNVETALNDVRNAVDSVRSDLPQDMTEPVISKVTTAGSAIVTFTVDSDRMDEEALSWFVDNEISKALLVGQGCRRGGTGRRRRPRGRRGPGPDAHGRARGHGLGHLGAPQAGPAGRLGRTRGHRRRGPVGADPGRRA